MRQSQTPAVPEKVPKPTRLASGVKAMAMTVPEKASLVARTSPVRGLMTQRRESKPRAATDPSPETLMALKLGSESFQVAVGVAAPWVQNSQVASRRTSRISRLETKAAVRMMLAKG